MRRQRSAAAATDIVDRRARTSRCSPPATPPIADAFARQLDELAKLGVAFPRGRPRPFLAAGALLYDGPWLAERHAAVGRFIEQHPTRSTRSPARSSATRRASTPSEAFAAEYRRRELGEDGGGDVARRRRDRRAVAAARSRRSRGRRRPDRGQRSTRAVLDVRQPARPVCGRRAGRAAGDGVPGRIHPDRAGAVRSVPAVARRAVPADGRSAARRARRRRRHHARDATPWRTSRPADDGRRWPSSVRISAASRSTINSCPAGRRSPPARRRRRTTGWSRSPTRCRRSPVCSGCQRRRGSGGDRGRGVGRSGRRVRFVRRRRACTARHRQGRTRRRLVGERVRVRTGRPRRRRRHHPPRRLACHLAWHAAPVRRC